MNCKHFQFARQGKHYDVSLKIGQYEESGNLKLELINCNPTEHIKPVEITIDLLDNINPWAAFIDTTMYPIIGFYNVNDMIEFFIAEQMAKDLDTIEPSGFFAYPLYQFNPNMLKACDPVGFTKYVTERRCL